MKERTKGLADVAVRSSSSSSSRLPDLTLISCWAVYVRTTLVLLIPGIQLSRCRRQDSMIVESQTDWIFD